MTVKYAFIPLFSAILLLNLSGCASRPGPAPVSHAPIATGTSLPPTVAPPRPELELASHAARLRHFPPVQLQAELASNRQRAKDAPTYENRLRLALTLWTAGGEDHEIQALVEWPQGESPDDQLRGIGLLMSAIISERRRNRELLASSQSRSRESRREQESQQSRLEALKRQIEDLERKLAAMRDLEKSLQQRP